MPWGVWALELFRAVKSRLVGLDHGSGRTIACMAPDPKSQNDDQNIIAIYDPESFRAEVNALPTLKLEVGLLDRLGSSKAATDGSATASAVAEVVAEAAKSVEVNDSALREVANELEFFRDTVARISADAATVIATA